MAAKRHQKTTARRVALQVLYTAEITNQTGSSVIESGTFPTEEGPLSDYATDLVRGVESNRIAIDGALRAAAENWSVGRMPIVDRSILRLAVYEMKFVDDVPVSVAINEAVDLAKDFGGEDDSPRFVNGVLGRIAKECEGAGAACAGGVASATGEVGADAESASADGGLEAPKLDDPAQPLV